MPIPVETAAGSRDQRQDVFGSGTPCASGTVRWTGEVAAEKILLAPATVAKAVNVLSLILAAAVRSQLLVVNPCAGLMLPSSRRAGDSILTVTRDEFAGKLLPVVPVEHRAIVSMAAGCGLRWGECAGLPWDAVDLDDAEVHVRQVVVELSGRLDLRPYPKTRAGRRTVPMPGFVVAALRAYLGDRQPVGL